MYRKQTLFFIALAFTLGGCFTSKAEVVYLPQKCEVTFPAYPLPKKNAVENLKELAARRTYKRERRSIIYFDDFAALPGKWVFKSHL